MHLILQKFGSKNNVEGQGCAEIFQHSADARARLSDNSDLRGGAASR